MLNNEFLNDLGARITRLLPLATEVKEETEKSIQQALQSAFSRMNLVTREEFDAQMKVLERAEQTITELEAKIAALEKSGKLTPRGRAGNAS
jgi:BMFP domain-containing protein YqiC